jgi:hypothetical protein
MPTITRPDPPRTVAELLLDHAAAEPNDGTAPPADGFADKLSASGRAWLHRQVIGALEQLLGAPLTDLLATAWSRGTEMIRAADATSGDPTAERLVLLHAHEVTYTQDLTVTVVYDERWRTDLRGQATLDFEVGRVEAVVRGGYLEDVLAGHAQVTGSLELEGNLIAERSIPLPVAITGPLPRPVDLARHRDTVEIARP